MIIYHERIIFVVYSVKLVDISSEAMIDDKAQFVFYSPVSYFYYICFEALGEGWVVEFWPVCWEQ